MKNTNDIVLEWLKETDISLSTISRRTGIARKTLHNWRTGASPSVSLLQKLTKYYNNLNNNEVILSDDGEIDKDYVIGLQKEKIVALEALNEKAKMERDIWEMLEFDSMFEVHMKIKGFRLYRSIVKATGLEMLAVELGYTLDELRDDYFCLGEWYEMKKHPIDRIMTKETKTSLQHYTDNFPALFQSMKSVVGDHYIPFNIVYVGKDDCCRVQASVYNRVFWREMKIESKVKMFA
tara:strand:+ start:389 stop:1096 length:708 start_codon:yes stop_codon:yes gene_type:complete